MFQHSPSCRSWIHALAAYPAEPDDHMLVPAFGLSTHSIAKIFTCLDLRTVLNARASSRFFKEAAAEFVQALLATDGVLPHQAWGKFLWERRLRVTTQQVGESRTIPPATFLCRLLDILQRAPERLVDLSVRSSLTFTLWDVQTSMQLARGLRGAALSQRLQVLILEPGIDRAAADLVFNSLPNLQDASVAVYQGDSNLCSDDWAPSDAAITHLRSLCLAPFPSHPDWIGVDLDLPSLSKATQLTRLCIGEVSAQDIPSLADVPSLQHIAFDNHFEILYDVDERDKLRYLKSLLSLPALKELLWPEFECRAASLLDSLQDRTQLCSLQLGTVVAGPGAAAPGLHKLAVARLMHLCPGGSSDMAGLLTRRYPSLRQLRTHALSLMEVAVALQGHTALEQLSYEKAHNGDAREALPVWEPGEAQVYQEPLPEWPRHLLSTLPRLQCLSLEEDSRRVLDRLVLEDVAGCSRLTSLTLKWGSRARFTADSAAALAAGACSRSLQTLVLQADGDGVGVEAVAALLRVGMQALREVRARLRLPLVVQCRQVAAMPADEVQALVVQELGPSMLVLASVSVLGMKGVSEMRRVGLIRELHEMFLVDVSLVLR